MPESFNLILKKSDKALNTEYIEDYKLSIQLSLDGFSFSIFDHSINKFLSIESYSVQGKISVQEFCKKFGQFVKEHPILNRPIRQVVFLIESPKTTLVPAPLFDEKEVQTFAEFNFLPDEGNLIFYDKLIYPDTFNLYPVPELMLKTIKELFPVSRVISHSSALIEGLMIQYKNLPEKKRIFANIRNSFLDIVVIEGKNLVYYNSFNYTTKEDFIYFIIFVFEQLNLNPEETELTLAGFIEKSSSLFEIVYKYIREIRFRGLSTNFTYSYIFDEIPPHYFTNLINSGLCEL